MVAGWVDSGRTADGFAALVLVGVGFATFLRIVGDLMRTSNSGCGRVCKTLRLKNLFGSDSRGSQVKSGSSVAERGGDTVRRWRLIGRPGRPGDSATATLWESGWLTD